MTLHTDPFRGPLVKTAGAIRRVPDGTPGLPVASPPSRRVEAGGLPLHHAAPVVAPTPGRLSALAATGVGTTAGEARQEAPMGA